MVRRQILQCKYSSKAYKKGKWYCPQNNFWALEPGVDKNVDKQHPYFYMLKKECLQNYCFHSAGEWSWTIVTLTFFFFSSETRVPYWMLEYTCSCSHDPAKCPSICPHSHHATAFCSFIHALPCLPSVYYRRNGSKKAWGMQWQLTKSIYSLPEWIASICHEIGSEALSSKTSPTKAKQMGHTAWQLRLWPPNFFVLDTRSCPKVRGPLFWHSCFVSDKCP